MVCDYNGVLLRLKAKKQDYPFVISGDQYRCPKCGTHAIYVDQKTKGCTEKAPRLGAYYIDVECKEHQQEVSEEGKSDE